MTKKTGQILKKDDTIQTDNLSEPQKNIFQEFKAFLEQYAIVGLAIGLVIGNTTQDAVKSIVDGLITPFLSIVLKLFLSNLGSIGEWTIPVFDGISFKPGIVIQSLIEFVIILFIIYVVVAKVLHRADILEKKK